MSFPAWARRAAATDPPNPEPMMTVSASVGRCSVSSRGQVGWVPVVCVLGVVGVVVMVMRCG